jgi:hypothetical protein
MTTTQLATAPVSLPVLWRRSYRARRGYKADVLYVFGP